MSAVASSSASAGGSAAATSTAVTVGAGVASADPLDLLRRAISTTTFPLITLLDSDRQATSSLSTAAFFSFPPSASASASASVDAPPETPLLLLPRDTPTRYTSRADTTTEFYTLAQLYLAYAERGAGVREYLSKGQEAGTGYVGIADRGAVVGYLEGGAEGGRVVRRGKEGEGESGRGFVGGPGGT